MASSINPHTGGQRAADIFKAVAYLSLAVVLACGALIAVVLTYKVLAFIGVPW